MTYFQISSYVGIASNTCNTSIIVIMTLKNMSAKESCGGKVTTRNVNETESEG